LMSGEEDGEGNIKRMQAAQTRDRQIKGPAVSVFKLGNRIQYV